MAIQTNYETHDMVYPDAYMVIRKITTGHADEDYFEFNEETGFENLKFKKVYESMMYVYIYSGKTARDNTVVPIDVINMPFEYDMASTKNIYEQAYDHLSKSPMLAELIHINV